MGLPLFKERRFNPRRGLTGLLPGKLIVSATGRALSCRPVDVSRDGMGIIVDEQLAPGTEVELHMAEGSLLLKVAWGQPDFGRRDLFRYGLVSLERHADLERLFADSGCLV